MFKLFNLYSKRKYYRKIILLMTIYRIAKTTLPKNISCNSCIAKKLNIRHITVLKVGKRLMSFVKPQINNNKTENMTSHQVTRTRIRLKIWRYFRNISPKFCLLSDNKLDSITLNLRGWPQDHTWQHLNFFGAFSHLCTNAAPLITADVVFQWWRHGTQLWGDCCERFRRSGKV